MYEALVVRVRYHIQKANFMGVKEAESTLLLAEAADAIEELIKIIPHNCFCCVGCEIEPENGHGCETGFVLSANRAKQYIEELSKPRWVPVTERLPEENAPCIVYNKYYGPMVGWRVDGERFRIPGPRFPDNPTHWMPLPSAPKEE